MRFMSDWLITWRTTTITTTTPMILDEIRWFLHIFQNLGCIENSGSGD